MKDNIIKYIFILCCLFLMPFYTYANELEENSILTQSEEQQIEDAINEIGTAKDKLTLDSIVKGYDELKNIEFKQETITQNNDSQKNLRDTIQEVSKSGIQYLYKFLQNNFVYLFILLILFILLNINKGGRCKLNGCLQSRKFRSKNKKH